MKPLREPAKASRELRYLLARANRDKRFSQLVDKLYRTAIEFLAPPLTFRSAANIVFHELQLLEYSARQTVAQEDSDCED